MELDPNPTIIEAVPDATGAFEQKYFFGNKKKVLIGVVIFLVLIIVIGIVLVTATTKKPKTHILTEKSSDSTIHIKKDDKVDITTKTFPDLKISTEIQNPSVVQPIDATRFKNGNYTGAFKADSHGETDILVTGQPDCKPGVVCNPLVVEVYKVHIIVDK